MSKIIKPLEIDIESQILIIEENLKSNKQYIIGSMNIIESMNNIENMNNTEYYTKKNINNNYTIYFIIISIITIILLFNMNFYSVHIFNL